jgi:hypothetical protein
MPSRKNSHVECRNNKKFGTREVVWRYPLSDERNRYYFSDPDSIGQRIFVGDIDYTEDGKKMFVLGASDAASESLSHPPVANRIIKELQK